jgi:hypothetical protein
MTALWNLYCKTMAESKPIFVYPDGSFIAMPEELKPTVLGQAILESGRGTTRLASGGYNFHGLKWRADIKVSFPIGKFPYNGGDGLFDYCEFFSLREEIAGYWAFVHRLPYYAGVDQHLSNGRDFLNWIGPHYCPPGYTSDWIKKHNGFNYTDLIYYVLRLEAIDELKKYGWKETPVNIPAPVPVPIPQPVGPFSITNGVLAGPQTSLRPVKNYDHFRRPKTDGIVLHGTGCLGGKGTNGPGILDGWDPPGLPSGVSAHILILRDGNVWQAVNLLNPAWHCYGHNTHTIGIELENIGLFPPWQEVLGWFFRFRGKVWEQKIAKKELIFMGGNWRQLYTSSQIDVLNQIIPALKTAFPSIVSVRGHSDYNAAWDPGIQFPWSLIGGKK